MKRDCILITTLCLLSLSMSGQSLKTYNGPFHGGQATYTYIEQEDGSRVYQGDFSWKQTINERDITAKGKFANGKRDGLWVFTATQTKNKSLPANETLRVDYVNGKHSGEYSYKASENYSEKGATGNYIKSEITSAPEGMALFATCKDNLFDGTLTITSKGGEKWEAQYNATASPYMTGIWKYSGKNVNCFYDRETNKQYMINLETGEKMDKISSAWSIFQTSIKTRCLDLEAFCEPYPKTSGRYEPITNYYF